MTDDPVIEAVRRTLDVSLADLRATIEGASPDALNWKPAGEGTNSLAVLATHSLHSTRSWICVALDAPLPERDRPAEFRATAEGAAQLLRSVDAMAEDCRRLAAEARDVDWGAVHRTHVRATPNVPPAEPAAWAMFHALGHLREHVGQMQLTRQLFDGTVTGDD